MQPTVLLDCNVNEFYNVTDPLPINIMAAEAGGDGAHDVISGKKRPAPSKGSQQPKKVLSVQSCSVLFIPILLGKTGV